MLQNHFKIAFRNLVNNKVFSVINIIGLGTGLTAFLLIALYVFDDLTFDGFHRNAANIYRIVEQKTTPEGKETKTAAVSYQLAEKASVDLPAIKNVARITDLGRANISATENETVFYETFWIANPGFLTTFDFPLLEGDRNTALSQPHTVIITAQTAKRFFGTTKVLGKALKIDRSDVPCHITGVLKDFPANSHIAFNACFSETTVTDSEFRNFIKTDWTSNSFPTYFLLDGTAKASQVEAQLKQLVAANTKSGTSTPGYILQPLKSVHFYSVDIEGNLGHVGNITYIYVFVVIALFILLIACINYTNLTTARFTNRAKEIAVRKVVGATRKSLMALFFAEAFLVTSIALLFAIILVELLLPKVNVFTEKHLTLGINTDYRIWLGVGVVLILVGFTSGAYPAFIQSRLNSMALFKRKISVGKGNLSVRSFLVVFQFALSITMIIATIVVYMQLKYVNTNNMGFDKSHLIVVDINSGKVRREAQTLKDEFRKLPAVRDVTVSSRVPGEWKNLAGIKVTGEKVQSREGTNMFFMGIDDTFLKTYGITLTKGRSFDDDGNVDSASIILNETAAKELGIAMPTEQRVTINSLQSNSFSSDGDAFKARVIGVVKDFNFQSLRLPLAPMVLGNQNNPVQNIDYFTVKVAPNNITQTLKQLEAVLHKIDQTHLFEYHFLDKQWELFYREDQIRQTIFLIVAFLTILIACLGLFGLATYAAEQRIKEIGIRKVMGASVSNIVALLSKDFIRLVFIAAAVAFPVAWWAMQQWLADFVYRINVSWWMFALAGTLAVVIALATISFQAIKAATSNPANSLRTE